MGSVARLTRQEAEDFLFEETRLLDECLCEAWLHLFTEDGLYWISIVELVAPATREQVPLEEPGA